MEVMKMLSNWRTTLTAIVGAFAAIVAAFGIHVSTEVQVAIVTVTMFFIGLFAGDGTDGDQARKSHGLK